MHLATGRLIVEGDTASARIRSILSEADRTWVNFLALRSGPLLVAPGRRRPCTGDCRRHSRRRYGWHPVVSSKARGSPFLPRWLRRLAISRRCPAIASSARADVIFLSGYLDASSIRTPKPGRFLAVPLIVAGLFCLWSISIPGSFLALPHCFFTHWGSISARDEGVGPSTLWKALALGIIACMVNPHHFRVGNPC